MRQFLKLAALLALLAMPSSANAVTKFIVLCATTCTWDNTNDTIWSTTSNGSNNTTHPTAADTVTIDASSCSGGTTCTITTNGTLAMSSLTMGACTASTTGCILDASVNNNNFNIGGTFSFTGTGTRTIKCGTGTFTVSGIPNVDFTTLTNATVTCGSVALVDGNTGTGTSTWALGGQTFGSFTAGANTNATAVSFTTAFTLNTTLSVTAPRNIGFLTSATATITGGFTLAGTATNPIYLFSNTSANTAATLSMGAASTCNWCIFKGITASGSAITSTNSLNISTAISAGTNTVTGPAAAGGGGGHIIGG